VLCYLEKIYGIGHATDYLNEKQVVEPVFTAYYLQSKMKCRPDSLNDTVIASDDVVQGPSKKLKVSSSSSSARQTSNVNPQFSTKV